MKKKIAIIVLTGIFIQATIACKEEEVLLQNDFQILKTEVVHHPDLEMTVWEISVTGNAGATKPTPIGKLDGAPVQGYVFPTTLKSTDVGFNETEGIVALALTAHPDFDDTPLWDENVDKNYVNDGVIWHPHWVVLNEDGRVKGGLSVKQFQKGDPSIILPPTKPRHAHVYG